MTAMPTTFSSDKGLARILSKAVIYQDYEKALTETRERPVSFPWPAKQSTEERAKEEDASFCELMAGSTKTCAACYALQGQLEREAKMQPRTLKCFAGLCESASPVRVGERLIAFLRTGHVLVHEPTPKEFRRITQTLIEWGVQVDLKQAEEAQLTTQVLSEDQYHAMVRLLSIFADHLAACGSLLGNQEILTKLPAEPPAIIKARSFVAENSDEPFTLADVAHSVNMSAHYFSQKFRAITGLKFTEFVSRIRVEKARKLMDNQHLQIAEIAYQVGFQSLSQFNRAFRQFMDTSPTQYRHSLVKP